MIRTLREVWRSWVDWTPPPEPLDVQHETLKRLVLMEHRLAAIHTAVTAETPLAPALSCGHISNSYATHPDGTTECLACHQQPRKRSG